MVPCGFIIIAQLPLYEFSFFYRALSKDFMDKHVFFASYNPISGYFRPFGKSFRHKISPLWILAFSDIFVKDFQDFWYSFRILPPFPLIFITASWFWCRSRAESESDRSAQNPIGQFSPISRCLSQPKWNHGNFSINPVWWNFRPFGITINPIKICEKIFFAPLEKWKQKTWSHKFYFVQNL